MKMPENIYYSSAEERTIAKRRFTRLFPDKRPMNDFEADCAVQGLKNSRLWNQILKEESCLK